MTTVKDVLHFIETLAPTYMKEDWDRVGLNCGHLDKAVNTVLVALDPFEDVCEEALEIGADLLVTHHALIWNAGFVTDEEYPLAFIVVVENGGYGTATCVPILSKVLAACKTLLDTQ